MLNVPSISRSLLTTILLVAGAGLAGVSDAQAQGGQKIATATAVRDLSEPTRSLLQRAVTLNLRNVTIPAALQELSQRSTVPISFSSAFLPDRRITLIAESMTLQEALESILFNTNTHYVFRQHVGILVIRDRAEARVQANRSGRITGIVRSADTDQPVKAASVAIERLGLQVLTDENGRFALTDVPVGTHTVSASIIGFAGVKQAVTVREGATAELNFTLTTEPLALDQLVVTGTIAQARQRELPNPITVLTAADIEERGITQVTQLFRGQVPGIVAPEQGQLDHTPVYVRGGAAFNVGDNVIKTYIDGVEIADPRVLNNIDPSMIERIEILRGPQASTLYGSQAIGGVMQIFTKKGVPGATRPSAEVMLSYGTIQNNATDGIAGRHDYSAIVRGGGERFSYNVGGSFRETGAWQPGLEVDNISYFGAVTLREGPVTAGLTLRLNGRDYTSGLDPIASRKIISGQYAYSPYTLVGSALDIATRQHTIGLNVNYTPTSWWQHRLVLGQDVSDVQTIRDEPTYVTPADSFLVVRGSNSRRNSIAYNTTAELRPLEQLSAIATLGMDKWTYASASFNAPRTTTTRGTLGPTAMSVIRADTWNTGYFGQLRLGLADRLFFTAGLRADDNPDFGDEYGLNYAPRYGLAYVHEIGSTTLKARASWGSAFRPPAPGRKELVETPYFYQTPNLALGPESQSGGDLGVEAYFQGLGSIIVTYFDQTVDGLITQAIFPRITPGQHTFMWQNLGDVSNKGYEFEASVYLGDFTLSGTYSTVDSKILALDSMYTGSLEVGDQLQNIAEASGAFSITYGVPGMSLRLESMYVGSTLSFDYAGYNDQTRSRLDRNFPPRDDYTYMYDPVWRFGLSGSRDVSELLNVFARVDNLTNDFGTDLRSDFPAMGRQATLGVRLTF